MAKKQTRRSVSIRGTTYERVRNFCSMQNISMSEFVEEQIASFFENSTHRRATAPSVVPTKPTKKTAAEPVSNKDLDFEELHDAARHFTF